MTSARPERIPEDVPFVVRTDRRKFALWFGGITLAGYLLLCCVVGSVLYLGARDLGTSPGVTVALVAIPLLALGLLLTVPVLVGHHRFVGRGPLLAADRTGLWVRNVGFLSRPQWLPWEAVRAVYPRQQGPEKLIWIEADSRYPGLPPGTRLVVTTLMSDHDARQILVALAGLAAGRTVVHPPG
ncbi:hypothetical protein GCM10022225_66530 [Plantactinospora mayteni]|uniref:PH domain-containing protein n=1 Tax=Plantactinospora mayteni TaxID=566021 RepID=A0ABQ4EPJ3_9ACTN|nr:hypothetical protein [Plantactinospora mayteni]GIG96566.1 hypothetical protein Pma05_31390 [Plantactinospora mayteni]